jgi:hypothetical protein
MPVDFTNGTFFPARFNSSTDVDKLVDNVYGQGTTWGAWTTTGQMNWIQIQMDAAYSDVGYMQIWAGRVSSESSSGYLSVFLSPTTNFSSGDATACAAGAGVNIMALPSPGGSGVVTCPPANSTLYVTILRVDPQGYAANLMINELRIYRNGEPFVSYL